MNASCIRRLWIPDAQCLKNCFSLVTLRTYCLQTDKLGYNGMKGLDAVVSYISTQMRKKGKIETDLLVIDNPASGEVVKQFEKAGVKKIVCTVKKEDHFMKIKKQLGGSHNVFLHNLLGMQKQGSVKLSKTVKKEAEILASVGNITGLVILASGISDIENYDVHIHLLNRIMTRNEDGFNIVKKIHWFLAVSQNRVASKHFMSNYSVIKLLSAFYKHQNGIIISRDESSSVFFDNLDSKKIKGSSSTKLKNEWKKISSIKRTDVHFMHFVLEPMVLKQLDLEERNAFKTFVCRINGPHRLIPALEKLVPGCGLRLIEQGYGMADEVQEIPANKLIQLYKDVKNLPEFEGSAFHALLTRKDAEIDLHYDFKWKWQLRKV